MTLLDYLEKNAAAENDGEDLWKAERLLDQLSDEDLVAVYHAIERGMVPGVGEEGPSGDGPMPGESAGPAAGPPEPPGPVGPGAAPPIPAEAVAAGQNPQMQAISAMLAKKGLPTHAPPPPLGQGALPEMPPKTAAFFGSLGVKHIEKEMGRPLSSSERKKAQGMLELVNSGNNFFNWGSAHRLLAHNKAKNHIVAALRKQKTAGIGQNVGDWFRRIGGNKAAAERSMSRRAERLFKHDPLMGNPDYAEGAREALSDLLPELGPRSIRNARWQAGGLAALLGGAGTVTGLGMRKDPAMEEKMALGSFFKQAEMATRHDMRKQAAAQGFVQDAILGEVIDQVTSGQVRTPDDVVRVRQQVTAIEKSAGVMDGVGKALWKGLKSTSGRGFTSPIRNLKGFSGMGGRITEAVERGRAGQGWGHLAYQAGQGAGRLAAPAAAGAVGYGGYRGVKALLGGGDKNQQNVNVYPR